MQIEWKDSFKLGDAEIDTQHQQLFALANEFLQASGKAELTLCAIQLYKYTREHFEVEEGVMRKLHLPGLASHVDWHNTMITRLNAISQSIQSNTLREQDLVQLMTDWAEKHILVHDAELIPYLIRK
jgi:hemerythrin-like metal-binding protein